MVEPGSNTSVTARFRYRSLWRSARLLGLKAGCAANAKASPVWTSNITRVPPRASWAATADFSSL